MTKEEIINDLNYIIDNLENLKQESLKASPERPSPYMVGVLTALITQVADEVPINRNVIFNSEKRAVSV